MTRQGSCSAHITAAFPTYAFDSTLATGQFQLLRTMHSTIFKWIGLKPDAVYEFTGAGGLIQERA
jgi:hypothetical protein